MLPEFNRIKGIHPGAILKRELIKRNIRSVQLAEAIEEYPQTINAITKERRGINPKLSYKLGHYFGTDEEYFMLLQAAHEVALFKEKQCKLENPIKGKFRVSIFWDTKIENIDIRKNKRSIIQRVLERGNQQEIKELIEIYSLPTIKIEISKIGVSFIPNYKKNVEKYILNIK